MATCRLSIAGAPVMRTFIASMRRNWSPCTRRYSGNWRHGRRRIATCDPQRADRVCENHRPGQPWLGRELGTAGRQRHGISPVRIWHCRKWLELLKQIVPNAKRAAVIRDVSETSGIGQMAAIQAVAPSFGIEVSPIDASVDASEIERAIAEFARGSNGGLIVTESGNRSLIAN